MFIEIKNDYLTCSLDLENVALGKHTCCAVRSSLYFSPVTQTAMHCHIHRCLASEDGRKQSFFNPDSPHGENYTCEL